MINEPTQQGSLWRRWDLHIHTPETKLSDCYKSEGEDRWEKFIKELEASAVQVFGITDYFCCKNYFTFVEKYKAKFPDSTKVFFPNIEFRLSDAIGREGKSPDLHVIFDNDEEVCSQENITKFLTKLIIHETDENEAEVSCADLKAGDFDSASVTLKAVSKTLNETFGKAQPYILVFPAKNDGMKSTDTESPRKISIADEIDKKSHAFFGGSTETDYFLLADRYEKGGSDSKPVFSGSDAHSFEDLERLSGDVTGFEPTWIKAELTFGGLVQTLFEPQARVHIGEIPSVLTRKSVEATKFITQLQVNQVDGYDEKNGQWFKNVTIPLNPELTAIIGNKGSGKSALADIIGLLGDSKQEDHFSFLTDRKANRKFRQKGYAENFSASLEWENGSVDEKILSENTDPTQSERVKYLPQHFFEKLTNEIEVKAFQDEIEHVVFSHVEETDRMGTKTFKELEELKTQESRREASSLKTQLRELNHAIAELKEQSKPRYRESLQKALLSKKAELKALESTFPEPVSEPAEESEEQKETSKKLENATQVLTLLEANERKCIDHLARKKADLEKLRALNTSLQALDAHIGAQKQENEKRCLELGLSIDEIIKTEIDRTPILAATKIVADEIRRLETDNEVTFDKETDYKTLSSIVDIRAAKEFVQKWIDTLKEMLSAPHKRYQNYLIKKAQSEQLQSAIKGDEEAPKPETIAFIVKEIAHVETALSQEILDAEEDRLKLSKHIFESKTLVLEYYKNLKSSVEEKLSVISDDDFKVTIEASFVQAPNLPENFFEFISQSKSGPFYNNGENTLRDHLSAVDWNDFESIHAFARTVSESMEKDDISEQIRKNKSVKEFYDFLFSLDYFEAKYELRLGGKNLNQLSPGEKGLLLLVFYLHLDRENIPLIIDQAEDNLDNDSIFKVLAKCIREAKKNRQVILVTHNPNLAVGADAEQIVYVKLEKHKNYRFSYESGAIEDPRTNENIVQVLEGSRPAFVQRRLKYHIR